MGWAWMEALEEQRLMRSKDLLRLGIQHPWLRDESLFIKRVARGVYVSTRQFERTRSPEPYIAARIPQAVFCLETALELHGLGSGGGAPATYWMALAPKARRPRVTEFPLRFARFRAALLCSGIEERLLWGLPIRVYSLAKTLADCLRYRAKLPPGLPERSILRALSEQRCTLDELCQHAVEGGVLKPLQQIVSQEEASTSSGSTRSTEAP